jgi:AraC-like DNA-binding protein
MADSFRSSDLDEVRAYIGTVFKPHTLRTLGGGRLDAAVNQHAVAAGSLVYFGYGDVTVEVDPGPLEDFYLLQFACRGSGRMRYGAREVELHPATSAACLSPLRATRGRFHRETNMLVMRIARRDLTAHYVQYLGYEPAKPLEFDPQISVDQIGGRQLANVVGLIAAQTDATPSAGGAELASLLYSTLIHVQPNSWRQLLLEQPVARVPKCVRTIRDFIDVHYGDDLTVERLAAMASVSPRALFAAFQRHLGVTPMNYLRDRRLEKARRRLGEATSATVTEIALRCGFAHLGRFAIAYRAAYGESPSATLAGACGGSYDAISESTIPVN